MRRCAGAVQKAKRGHVRALQKAKRRRAAALQGAACKEIEEARPGSRMRKDPCTDSEVTLYQTGGGKSRLQVHFSGETAWLSLSQLSELFHRDKSFISKHVKNIFEEGELRPEATAAKFATVQAEGDRAVSREIEFYNLDVIISVGYRVKSYRYSGSDQGKSGYDG
jgi:hypothetical protein